MKNVSNKSAIQDFLKQRPQVKASKPKFDVGDVIINTKFKVISKIIEIKGIFDNEDRTANYDVAQYVMKDIKNDARDTFLANKLTTQDSRGMSDKRNYKRMKYCQAIDATYHKINPDVAQALYGVRVTEGDKDV